MRIQALALERWPEKMLDPRAQPTVDLVGVPGLYHAPPGWDTGMRTLDSHLFYLVAHGSFEAEVGAEQRTVRTGDLIWVSRMRAFRFRQSGRARVSYHRFRLQLHSGGVCYALPMPMLYAPALPDGAQWCARIVREVRAPDRHADTMLRAALAGLLTQIARQASPAHESPRGLTPAQRQAIADLLAQREQNWPTLADLARTAGLSPDYFSRLFQQSHGLSVRQWLVQQRIQKACTFLTETTHPVGTVARLLGYRDLFYFCRQFRQVTGTTPTAYRQKPAR